MPIRAGALAFDNYVLYTLQLSPFTGLSIPPFYCTVCLPSPPRRRLLSMEPWKQCTIVFAIIFTEPASECVCGGGGGDTLPPSLPLASSVRIYAKTTVHCSLGSSMLLSNVCFARVAHLLPKTSCRVLRTIAKFIIPDWGI